MAKKILGYIKLQVPAAAATPPSCRRAAAARAFTLTSMIAAVSTITPQRRFSDTHARCTPAMFDLVFMLL